MGFFFTLQDCHIQVGIWKPLSPVSFGFHWLCFLYYAIFISHYPADKRGHAILDESSMSPLMEEIIFQRHGGKDLFVS